MKLPLMIKKLVKSSDRGTLRAEHPLIIKQHVEGSDRGTLSQNAFVMLVLPMQQNVTNVTTPTEFSQGAQASTMELHFERPAHSEQNREETFS